MGILPIKKIWFNSFQSNPAPTPRDPDINIKVIYILIRLQNCHKSPIFSRLKTRFWSIKTLARWRINQLFCFNWATPMNSICSFHTQWNRQNTERTEWLEEWRTGVRVGDTPDTHITQSDPRPWVSVLSDTAEGHNIHIVTQGIYDPSELDIIFVRFSY